MSLGFQMDLDAENPSNDTKSERCKDRVALGVLVPAYNTPLQESDPQRLTYYSHEIFHYLLTAEVAYCPPTDYMSRQSDITYKMRAILVDWLVTVHLKFKLLPETLFLTVSLIDRYLSLREVNRQRLQLVGVTAMLVASKYEEIYPPEVLDFVHITDKAYKKEEVLEMERDLLATLQYEVSGPTAWRFLQRFTTVASTEEKFCCFARYLAELALIEYHMLKYRMSVIAAAATYISMKAQSRDRTWDQSLIDASCYTDQDLKPCIKDLLILYHSAPRHSLTGVRDKFSRREYHEISQFRLE